MCDIIRVPVGSSNAYILRSPTATVLVDTGVSWRVRRLRASLASHGVSVPDITLIILTHCHYDHVGSLAKIRDESGAPVLVHEGEARYLREGRMPLPPGMNGPLRAVVATAVALFPHAGGYEAVAPDILVSGDYDLSPHGLRGVVVPTPGHTPGSVSVVLGPAAVVGDLMYNLGLRTVFPPFAEDIPAVLDSWAALMSLGCAEFHPGHGRPVDREWLQRCLDARRAAP